MTHAIASLDARLTPVSASRHAEVSPVPRCAWFTACHDAPVAHRITWAHESPEQVAACWAGPESHGHRSHSCAGHLRAELDDLGGLGLVVTSVDVIV